MGTELATMNGHGNGLATVALRVDFTEEQIGLLKRTICQGATDDEFQLFLGQCKRTRLDPFAKQIHAVKRWDAKAGREVMAIQTGIDGYRLIADRTGEYEGQTPPMWCGADGVWKDVWLSDEFPAASRSGVYKKGFRDPIYSVALWKEYVQMYKPKGSNSLVVSPMWQKMGALMLNKCAEAQALRKAFPQELSGIYTAEEMAQADTAPAITDAQPVNDAPPPVDDPARKAWKAWRAKVNKKLQEAKTLEDLAKYRAGFEEVTKMGPELWAQWTYHNEVETFGMLFDQHRERVERDLELAGPEGIKMWLASLEMVGTVKELGYYVNQMRAEKRLQDSYDVEDALHNKALALGLANYGEAVMEEEEDRFAETEARLGDKA